MVSEIHVSAILITNPAGEVLHVRKRGTHMFMLPGGKPEPGESAAETAVREFQEELSVTLQLSELIDYGVFRAAAANESGFTVVAHVFRHPYISSLAAIIATAEIAELEWIHPTTTRENIAPLNTIHLFPALLS